MGKAKNKKKVDRNDEKKFAKKSKQRKAKGVSSTYLRYYKKLYDGRINLSSDCVKVMDSFMSDMFERICREASQLCRKSGRKTLTDHDMEFSTKLVLSEIPLVEGAVGHARNALKLLRNEVSVIPETSDDDDDSESEPFTFVSSSVCEDSNSSSGNSTDYNTFVANIINRSSPNVPVAAFAVQSPVAIENEEAAGSSTTYSFSTPPEG